MLYKHPVLGARCLIVNQPTGRCRGRASQVSASNKMARTELFFCSIFLMNALVLGHLQVGFYNSTCPQAVSIIHSVVQTHFRTDHSIPAALLRMHFHDCFVRGCDASILIDSTTKSLSEKAAIPNLTVRGFEIIDEAKAILEAQCPSIVSCADIIAVATRDAVALAGGPGYDLPTGRRDGLVSRFHDVHLPGPSSSVSHALQMFATKGLTPDDMVALLGAHTVGVAHCDFFMDRLFDFDDTGAPDPTLSPKLRARLAGACTNGNFESLMKEPKAFLDQNTPFVFDNMYYNQILAGRGVLKIDQRLASDNSTTPVVTKFAADGHEFLRKFADAMVKLGSVDVLVGSAGEIRKNCRAFNPPARAS